MDRTLDVEKAEKAKRGSGIAIRNIAAWVLLVILAVASWTRVWQWRPLWLPYQTAVVDRTGLQLGVGKADVTGPIVEIEMMGYASKDQMGTGLHIRQYSRAFIFSEAGTSFVYISADICMGDWAVKSQVLAALERKYGQLYHERNVAIVGTHTHAGTAGFLNYLLPQIPSRGFHKPTLDAIVDGIVKSVQEAHDALQPGKLFFSKGEILDANLNRSPSAYLANPKEERDSYEYDQDKEMSLLTLQGQDGLPLGLLNWFAVHGTSMYNNNTLISGDNKGAAAQFVEQRIASETGRPSFVAGFSQSNVGDTSPNTLGAFCEDTGEPCDFFASTCNNRTALCKGRGPGYQISDKESTKIIGEKQANGAYKLWETKDKVGLDGPVRAVQGHFDMSTYTFEMKGKSMSTCPAALGYSFAGGTTDGPGAFDFTQGDNRTSQNPFWEVVKRFIKSPSAAQIECHKPKPILLDIGEIHRPYEWGPSKMDVQLFQVGSLFILVVPGEFTTMAGRRVRRAVETALEEQGVLKKDEGSVVLGGPANVYGHYVTTPEEYDLQRYEGASTIFGPNTLDAYIDIFVNQLVPALLGKDDRPSRAVSAPEDLSSVAQSYIRPVIQDSTPPGMDFGSIITDVEPSYCGTANISVVFQGANPRNNVRHGSTFLTVERLNADNGQWDIVHTDDDWSTELRWKKVGRFAGYSQTTVSWYPHESQSPPGKYRINYFGDHKSLFGIKAFQGASSSFEYKSRCSV